MTDEVATGVRLSQSLYNLRTAARAELLRIELNEKMAALFDQVDSRHLCDESGPGVRGQMRRRATRRGARSSPRCPGRPDGSPCDRRSALTRGASSVATALPNHLIEAFSRRNADFVAMGGLTVISNVYGNPAVSIPAGTIGGLPIGLQVLAKHHHDDLLFDLALVQERHRPWPLVAVDQPIRG